MKTDGSVIIDTKIVDGGMEKGFEAIKNEMSSVGVEVEGLGEKIKKALSSGASVSVQAAFAKVQQLEAQLDSVTASFKEAIVSDDDKGAEMLGNRRIAIYKQLEAARFRLANIVTGAAAKEEAAEAKSARRALAEKQRAYKKATASARAFGKRLTSLMSSALVFSVIYRGLREVTQYFGKALKSNKKFSEAWGKLKGAALTALQPIYEVLLPILTTAVETAAKLVLLIGKAFASLTGKSAAQMQENAEALNDQATATEKAGKAAEKAKKQMAGFDEINTMSGGNATDDTESISGAANFELQNIDLNTKLSDMAELASEAIFALGIILTLSGANIPLGLGMMVMGGLALYESIAENWGGPESNVISTAEAIALIGGAVILAIGIIICFACPTHLGLGLGLVIGGAALLGTEVATNWNAIKTALKDPAVAAVAAIGGAFLVVLGILLCCAQAWGFGIGLIVAGAAFLGGTIAINWNSIKDALQGPIGAVVAAVSAALLAIGAILAFTGINLVLGIALIAAGAVGLATTTALNWDTIKEKLQGPLGKIVAIVSGALLVLGILLLLTGVGIPLGIGLIAAGAVGLATVIALNWDTIVTTVKEKFGIISEWIQTHGFAMLILGIFLLFSGVAIPVGLALIGLGVKGMVSGKDPLWNTIFEKIKEVWGRIKIFWNTHIAKVFTGQFWQDLAKKCGNGLIGGFESAVNGIISLFESMINWIVGGLNKISIDVPDWVPGIGGTKFGFNIPEARFGRLSIPRLAQGAVIPPNREFMAVLGDQKHGTNIEAPLETIKQALAEVLALQGAGGETVVTVNFTGDLAQLARVLKPAIETETRRKGGSLASGGSY